MIPRYDIKEISEIWSEHSKFSCYLEVELALLKALEGDRLPVGTSSSIREKAQINPERINEIEKEVKHDIIAFCTSITENIDPEVGKYFHYGVTSSDIIDTSINLQIKKSLEVILPQYRDLLSSLFSFANNHKNLPCLGRSHGMNAEPMSFGGKFLGHYAELYRHYLDLKKFYDNEITGQLSGAVGNYTILTPEVEKLAIESLGLRVEPYSTQVIPRDRIAKLVGIGALFGSAMERLCVEIRHLHHSDIFELHEGFAKGQKGSSTMPHKKNPISGENLTGMARILKSHLLMAHENVVLWHERDISHSSTERMYLPDHLGIFSYSLKRLKNTIDNLQVHEEIIVKKVKENHTYLSSFYLHKLIDQTNLKREDLYKVVQAAAFNSPGGAKEFYDALLTELKILKITDVELPIPSLEEITKIYLGNIEKIFLRVEGSYPSAALKQ